MNIFRHLGFLSILISLIGCTAFQTSTELHRGRVALLRGMPDLAVAHFTQVTALDGNVRYSQLQEGGWTYLGRAYYEAKKYPEARQALELARQGNYETGQKEVLLGLRGLYDWLDYIAYNTPSGVYWDPTGQIRAELQATQRSVRAANPNLDPLFARLESLGTRIEKEIDLARKDEIRDRDRKSSGSDD
jgi:hypothetical protein